MNQIAAAVAAVVMTVAAAVDTGVVEIAAVAVAIAAAVVVAADTVEVEAAVIAAAVVDIVAAATVAAAAIAAAVVAAEEDIRSRQAPFLFIYYPVDGISHMCRFVPGRVPVDKT